MKKDGEDDVEMKVDDSPEKSGGDISPITGTISNLPPDSDPSPPKLLTKRKSEPSWESLPNFSRVTPAQLAFISFPGEGRYQPVRAVSSSSSPSPSRKGGKGRANANVHLRKGGGGGGILLLNDLRPGEEGEFIDFAPPAAVPVVDVGGGGATAAVPSGPHVALDEGAPEADVPGPFEVGFFFFVLLCGGLD